jgi:hypothetical protein
VRYIPLPCWKHFESLVLTILTNNAFAVARLGSHKRSRTIDCIDFDYCHLPTLLAWSLYFPSIDCLTSEEVAPWHVLSIPEFVYAGFTTNGMHQLKRVRHSMRESAMHLSLLPDVQSSKTIASDHVSLTRVRVQIPTLIICKRSTTRPRTSCL